MYRITAGLECARMSIRQTVLGRIADPYSPGSLGYRARAKRTAWMLKRFPDYRDMKVLDLGGDTRFWRAATVRPAHVTIVGVEEWSLLDPEPWMHVLLADACDPDAIPGGFDLVFSNSVIEHVGGPRYRRGFAQTVMQSGTHFWVQTPYRYFPLEPHLVFPAFQFLPPVAKVKVAKHWPLSAISSRDDVEPVSYVMDHELVTVTEMQALFPGAELLRERVGPLVKSLVAVR
jgi:hypothetical protein